MLLGQNHCFFSGWQTCCRPIAVGPCTWRPSRVMGPQFQQLVYLKACHS